MRIMGTVCAQHSKMIATDRQSHLKIELMKIATELQQIKCELFAYL